MSVDYTAIKRLRLQEAFNDNEKFQKIAADDDYLEELFSETHRGKIYIHDDETEGHSIFIEDTNGIGSDKIFEITNSGHQELFLWHIDGVLFKKDSKCDCGFLTNNYVGFVEFKSNALNNSREAIKANYNKAVSQLKLTITEVKNRCERIGVDLLAESPIEAFAVFDKTVPKDKASQKNLAVKFQLEMEGIPLNFSNEKKL